ncbi:hypothetical protein PNEG_00375 [Pneumocystis murina B123]|uniref:Uncharacterized protein n=1 Tax=Pneumocystis murina (strain B123) TaxID=1069680 RepID=M7NW46_PNEMU|nr:hypothetical protein PNEG_00375 [Pneumocystis murina B123]EMR11346.1 hypothetical protein PNEG_00375 [Pneumocystis murina B123]
MEKSTFPLNPSICFDISYIKNFLRFSRAQLDDTITFHLNSLSIEKPFISESLKTKPLQLDVNLQPDTKTCLSFIHQVFNVWETRSSLISYCQSVAVKMEDSSTSNTSFISSSVDTRKDPYSGRTCIHETKQRMLQNILNMEERVEHVVRNHSWERIVRRCGFLQLPETYQTAMDNWHEKYIKDKPLDTSHLT